MRINHLTAAAVTALVLGAAGAQAADMPVYYEQQAEAEFGGWYLRGDIGGSKQISDDLDSPVFDVIATPGNFVDVQDSEWGASWFIAAGIGYQVNEWLRVDVTGEYRGKSDFNGQDVYDADGDPEIDGTNLYDGEKEEAVFLLNGYWDFAVTDTIKPYLGAGVGAAWVRISDFSDTNPTTSALGISDSTETWNFAAALYAGVGFELSQNLTLDVGYRFLYMGDASTEDLVSPDGTNATFNPFEFDSIMSHDVKVGLRYAM